MSRSIDHISSSPLEWPEEYDRTREFKREEWPGRLDGKTDGEIRDDLIHEAELTGDPEKALVISTNLETYEKNGRQVPYANQSEPDDPGVAVYLHIEGTPRAFACDRYEKVHGNMRAITITLRDMRHIEKRGVNEGERIYQGFPQLPAKGETDGPAWWDLLDVDPDSCTMEEVRKAYQEKAKEVHPDRGGSKEEFNQLQTAYEQANTYIADQVTS